VRSGFNEWREERDRRKETGNGTFSWRPFSPVVLPQKRDCLLERCSRRCWNYRSAVHVIIISHVFECTRAVSMFLSFVFSIRKPNRQLRSETQSLPAIFRQCTFLSLGKRCGMFLFHAGWMASMPSSMLRIYERARFWAPWPFNIQPTFVKFYRLWDQCIFLAATLYEYLLDML